MEPTDITIHVLREIRDEMRGMRTELSERIDQTNERLDRHEQVLVQLVHQTESTNERLDRHERALGLLINEVRGLGSRIDNLVTGPMGEKVRELDRRVATLESRAGIGQP
jgi:chromosome segregation ATPase